MEKVIGQKYNMTKREQEVLNLLLEGLVPKEIASSLNISYATVLDHKKNIYRKLEVHNIHELLTNFSNMSIIDKEIIFVYWISIEDKKGSKISISQKIENFKEKYYKTYYINGNRYEANDSYVGTYFVPDEYTLEVMRKMNSLSFNVLGDGNSYYFLLPTTESRLNGGNNHYYKIFETKNAEISTIEINLNELAQLPYFGNKIIFNENNIEGFQINVCSYGEFNLKFWDIKFHY